MRTSESNKKKPSRFRIIKNGIKNKRYSQNPIIRFVVERLFDFSYILGTMKGILINKQSRAVFFTKLRYPNRIHQTTPATAMNRFPLIFSACRGCFEEKSDIKILSFGCSTGEEVLTLRHYFPNATIVGAEINKYSLEICQKRKLDDKMIFIKSTSEEISKHGPYDAIFCMAVFQRTLGLIAEKRITDLSRIYPFRRFADQICELDPCLRKDGLFVVHFSQYDFRDTEVASKYSTYGDYNQDCYWPYIFDKNSKLVTTKVQRNSIFVKVTE